MAESLSYGIEGKEFVNRPLFDENILLNKDLSWPKISIVTPSYNQGEFLERTILSVLNQNYPNLELIIIDGGSTDGSVDIIKKYKSYYHYWVSKPDKNHSQAVNEGFLHSSGEILGWLNSDDTYLPNALLAVGQAFKENPGVDIVYSNGNFIDTKDNFLKKYPVVPLSKMSFVYYVNGLFQQSTFWRRDIFFEMGQINENKSYSMDIDLFFKFIKSGARLYFLDKYIGNMRLHGDSKTVIKAKGEGYGEPETRESRLENFNIDDRTLRFRITREYFRLRKAFYLLIRGELRYLLRAFFEKVSRRDIWTKSDT